MNKWFVIIMVSCLTMLSAGCDNWEYHPYASDIDGKVTLNTLYKEQIEKSGIRPPFKFAFISDTQSSLDELKDAVGIIKKRGDIDFIIHGGDMTDFGMTREFLWNRDAMEKAGIPYVTVIGNHDCLGNGKETFEYVYGPENYSFNVANTHFLCLNTIALEYDYSKPVPDLNFIDADIEKVKEINHST